MRPTCQRRMQMMHGCTAATLQAALLELPGCSYWRASSAWRPWCPLEAPLLAAAPGCVALLPCWAPSLGSTWPSNCFLLKLSFRYGCTAHSSCYCSTSRVCMAGKPPAVPHAISGSAMAAKRLLVWLQRLSAVSCPSSLSCSTLQLFPAQSHHQLWLQSVLTTLASASCFYKTALVAVHRQFIRISCLLTCKCLYVQHSRL